VQKKNIKESIAWYGMYGMVCMINQNDLINWFN
jgi:hypothetical protein